MNLVGAVCNVVQTHSCNSNNFGYTISGKLKAKVF